MARNAWAILRGCMSWCDSRTRVSRRGRARIAWNWKARRFIIWTRLRRTNSCSDSPRWGSGPYGKAYGGSLLRISPHGLEDDFPFALLLAGGQRVCQELMATSFAAQLAVALEAQRVEPAFVDRLPHGASSFVLVAAIAVAALGGEGADIVEDGVHTIAGGPEL